MGLLDSVIGGVLGQVLGGGRGGGGSTMSPIVKALLMLLMAKGAGGGLGDIFGGGRQEPEPRDDQMGRGGPYGRDDGPGTGAGYDHGEGSGDIGGFGQGGRGEDLGSGGAGRGNDYGDLAGMLDGPGEARQNQGAGPYAHLDREARGEPDLGGLDGLMDRFRQGGLGDVMDSWIGSGHNRSIPGNRLAEALGPDTVDTLERQTGMGRDDLLAELAKALPGVIDALTPQGRMPTPEERRNW